MKRLNLIFLVFGILFAMSSCKDDNATDGSHAETLTITNLFAQSDVRDRMTGEIIEEKEYVYFDFSSGQIVSKDQEWDLGFKGTSIIVNGGTSGTGNVSATVVATTFADLQTAPDDSEMSQDTDVSYAIPAGSDRGWYHYNPANHLIEPLAGRIIVLKTAEGNYAKMEITSYYKDSPVNPDPLVDAQDYFTFNYAYQASGSKDF